MLHEGSKYSDGKKVFNKFKDCVVLREVKRVDNDNIDANLFKNLLDEARRGNYYKEIIQLLKTRSIS